MVAVIEEQEVAPSTVSEADAGSFTVNGKAWKAALQGVGRSVDRWCAHPPAKCVLVRCEYGLVTLTATDLQRTDTVWLTDQGVGTWQALVPLAAAKAVKPKAKDTLSVSPLPGGKGVRVTVGAFTSELVAESPVDEYPRLPEAPDDGWLPASGFLAAASMVAVAASKDDSRLILTGIRVEPADGGCTLVGTDSYRLAAVESSVKLPECLVPAKFLTDASKLHGDHNPRVAMDDGQLWVLSDVGVSSVRLIVGEFPNWHGLIPSDGAATVVLDVDAAEWSEAVKALGGFCTDGTPIRVQFHDGKVTLVVRDATAGGGAAAVGANVSGDGRAFEVAFNPSYLADLLGQCGESAELRFVDAAKPAVIRNGGFKSILMPVRVS